MPLYIENVLLFNQLHLEPPLRGGDKLKVIGLAIGTLNSEGLFIANLDLNNIIIEEAKSNSFLKSFFKREQIEYNPKSKILQRTGGTNIRFGLTYKGADDNAGPNYTGQEAVNSYYSL